MLSSSVTIPPSYCIPDAWRERARQASMGMKQQQQQPSSPWRAENGRDEKRFAVLLTGDATPYSEKKYGGYGQMFLDMLKEPGECWDVFRLLDGAFPDMQEVDTYHAFVITGSRYDAHGQEAWILQLCHLLRLLHHKRKKVLGVCFGHQVLARALGGKTGRASVGWELGVRKIHLTEAFASKSYASSFPSVLRIIESHRDQVSEIPSDAELLGSSERTPIEIFAIGDHILAIQGHPEFREDVVLDLIDTRLALGVITEDVASNARASVEKIKPDREAWENICRDFIRG